MPVYATYRIGSVEVLSTTGEAWSDALVIGLANGDVAIYKPLTHAIADRRLRYAAPNKLPNTHRREPGGSAREKASREMHPARDGRCVPGLRCWL